MNITGTNSIQNHIFDGGYSAFFDSSGLNFSTMGVIVDATVSGELVAAGINPTGITGGLVYYNAGTHIASGFLPKTHANGISGADSVETSQSGYLYSRITKPLYGVCHGFGKDGDVWYKGYNFYNAFHPEGHFSPPFGQHTTVIQLNEEGRDALATNGSCPNFTVSEYNDLFGIVSQTDPAVEASTDTLSANALSFINSPAVACPQDLSVTFYWHEKQYKIIAGTAGAIAGRTFYNNNPMPTALDNFVSKTTRRYSASGEDTNTLLDNGDGTKTSVMVYTVNYDASGKPIPAFPTGAGTSAINTPSCQGILAEGQVRIGTQTHSQLLDAPDILGEPSKGQFDHFNWWNIWHFLFKENSDGFPFENGNDNYGMNFGLTRSIIGNHSNLFRANLSDSEIFWQRRQCPEAITAVPHTFGASIYACPSYHFEIPYYAATKKFGFYGARFLNGCVSLDLSYPLNGNPNALEIGPNESWIEPLSEEPNNDKGINGGFGVYNNLLKLAKAEEKTSDFYALNKTLFLWANSGIIQQFPTYAFLQDNAAFTVLFQNLFNELNAQFPEGKNGLLTGQTLFQSGESSQFYPTNPPYENLSHNTSYRFFRHELDKVLTLNQKTYWNEIESRFGVAFMESNGSVDTGFYDALTTSRESRIRGRYLENYVKGNAIDLFPTNKIHFSYDVAGDVADSSNWGKASSGFGSNSQFDDIKLNRRYFLGAYTKGEDAAGLTNFLAKFTNLKNSSFYPGYFDSNIGLELPTMAYQPVITGSISSGSATRPLGNGWLAAGYNGVGELKGNFSCFTPIITQQPMRKVYCKIGQSPTFRISAVDYHTIPEDKMDIRHPEIVFWMTKLKIRGGSGKYKNRYPLSYKWYRILKSDVSNDFKNFLLNPDFSKISPSDPNGEWCALEGDGPVCTLIHPQDCEPTFTPNAAWSHKYHNFPAFEAAKRNNFYMELKKGAIKGDDDDYYYFCMVRGRFGIRISEPSELFIEDWLKFDVSVQNGGNVGATPTVKFIAGDIEITCSANSVPKYAGFVQDADAVPEDVVEQQLPPPNRGYGDVHSYKFVGMWGYRGANQSYTPGTLKDTRGLKQTYGRLLHYGSLVNYSATLTQEEGDALYGQNHLPTCQNHEMPEGQEGVKVVIDGMIHWANMQYPIVNTNGRYGVKWDKLTNAGMLYVPKTHITNAGQVDTSPGIGQWQWGNNLGTIHLFGWDSPKSILTQFPDALSDDDFIKLKNNLVKDPVLAGENCGWHKNGLGRNMLYWIEGFSSFYLFCDPLKKKNVTNYNYMNPGLRQTNSSIQYFWLGKPNNSYLERYPLFGPYAYQWKMRPHNRDRNGNGVSEGFYSYGWGTNYSMQYDAAAIYGMFLKYGKSNRDLETLETARNSVFGTNLQGVKSTRFGFTNGDGGARRYGTIWIGNISDETPNPTRDYVTSGEYHARTPEFELYGCSDEDVKNGSCFDPCLSMRYQFGLLAGGKKQDLATFYPDGNGYRLVANSVADMGGVSESTVKDANDIYFRGPFGTPHLQYLKQQVTHSTHELNGFSPCFDGGAEHCNYMTATLNIGSSMYQEANRSQFMDNISAAANAITLGGAV